MSLIKKQLQIESSVTQSIVKKPLNIIERLAGENGDLKNKLQELNDEIARLKGEQRKPHGFLIKNSREL